MSGCVLFAVLSLSLSTPPLSSASSPNLLGAALGEGVRREQVTFTLQYTGVLELALFLPFEMLTYPHTPHPPFTREIFYHVGTTKSSDVFEYVYVQTPSSSLSLSLSLFAFPRADFCIFPLCLPARQSCALNPPRTPSAHTTPPSSHSF